MREAIQRGLGRGFQAPEVNSGDSPSAFPHSLLNHERDRFFFVMIVFCLIFILTHNLEK